MAKIDHTISPLLKAALHCFIASGTAGARRHQATWNGVKGPLDFEVVAHTWATQRQEDNRAEQAAPLPVVVAE